MYLEYLEYEKNFSFHTIRAYHKDVLDFLVYISQKNIHIHSLKNSDFRAYFTSILKKGLKARSQARKTSCLRSFFNFLEKRKLLDYNPSKLIKTPRLSKMLPHSIKIKELNKIFENKEVENKEVENKKRKFYHLIHLRDQAICELLYSSGMRISELLSIKQEEIQSLPNSIKIKGKGRKERFIYIGSYAKVALQKYIEEKDKYFPSKKNFFINHHGQALSDRGIRFCLEKLGQKLGLDQRLSPHKFRHAFASDLLNEGAGLRTVQELLGHKSISTTQIYTHISKERLRDIYRSCHPHGK